ncbi:MAG: type I-A CRISPR-associated protein Cas5a [Infirmifilum sp.]
MKAYIFDVEFTWGFQARIAGLSKSPPSYLFPPPTTVIGAIAERVARRLGRGEASAVETMSTISSSLLALTFKPLNVFPSHYMTLSRVYAIGNRGGVNYPTARDVYLYKSFDAPARGSTFYGTVDGEPPRIRYFVVARDDTVVTLGDLWGVKRLGSRESLVSVVMAAEARVEQKMSEGRVFTAVPLAQGVEVLEGEESCLREYYVYPYNLSDAPVRIYHLNPSLVIQYLIPIPYFETSKQGLKVRVDGEKFVIYQVRSEEGVEGVVGLAS